MHEMGIAVDLIEQVLKIGKQNNLISISEIEVEAGALRLIEPEAMCIAWESVCDNTIAAGSMLKLSEVSPSASCRKCKNTFTPKIDDFRCTQCGMADIDLIGGNDLLLKSITGDKKE
jgi:hydrogenase nickel incorporation protein HypA/HybF